MSNEVTVYNDVIRIITPEYKIIVNTSGDIFRMSVPNKDYIEPLIFIEKKDELECRVKECVKCSLL